tara:strand:- start:2343 stop:2579 length:237 start_codon:yes stop_codon:yes gene_type:complete
MRLIERILGSHFGLGFLYWFGVLIHWVLLLLNEIATFDPKIKNVQNESLLDERMRTCRIKLLLKNVHNHTLDKMCALN